MVTGWAGGVSSPHCCSNIPSEACAIADVVNEFLTTSSFTPYDTKDHTGCWRTMTIRSSRRTGECMVIVVHSSQGKDESNSDESTSQTDDARNSFKKEQQRLVEALVSANLPDTAEGVVKLTSVCWI
jgi:tRNA/tmRNA/rRNA uracil-C5-methylase (TrmA/RlmC/RlmD family)